MNARDELIDVILPVLEKCFESGWNMTYSEMVADALAAAGYRKIFDGDCGLSNIKDPTEREAAEAWMRFSNIVLGNEHDGIAAMKQMLTEFGYRHPRTITTAEELDALPVGSVVRLLDRGYVYERIGAIEGWSTFPEDDWASPLHYVFDYDWLPATVLYEPEQP